jgi:hypothetical protein
VTVVLVLNHCRARRAIHRAAYIGTRSAFGSGVSKKLYFHSLNFAQERCKRNSASARSTRVAFSLESGFAARSGSSGAVTGPF